MKARQIIKRNLSFLEFCDWRFDEDIVYIKKNNKFYYLSLNAKKIHPSSYTNKEWKEDKLKGDLSKTNKSINLGEYIMVAN